MKKNLLSLLIICCMFSARVLASCTPGNSEVIIQIVPDAFPQEISWVLYDNAGAQLGSGGASGDTLCLPTGACDVLAMYDTYGDGILSPGGFYVYIDGVLRVNNPHYTSSYTTTFNCPPGSFCNDPIAIDTGSYTAPAADSWYSFTAATTGTYLLTTCGTNTCNTQIWVYSSCPTIPYQDNATGTFAYNDDNACGTQADMNVVFMAGTTYLIRIGDFGSDCTGAINFQLGYVGPVMGCMDPSSCNYNPIASVDDGSCIYFPNPLCAGPDLQLDSLSFLNSLSIVTHNTSGCDVDEGCVTGYGTRYVLSFTSKINNIGTLDYYIGSPSSQPGMFNTNNCHGHAHYEGYGDYRLFDSNGNLVPAGHKNGYCVIDLCGHGQYTCGNMGISTNCYDEYGAGTQCQWIDLTDVPTGDYRVAVIINSKHLPDALGHYEINFANNALQVCMHIVHNQVGPPTYTILPNCQPYIDCMGVPGGANEMDCNAICNGPAVFGDTYVNSALDSNDVITYMSLVQQGVQATNCYDLNDDNSISVYDASLMNWCLHGNNSHPGGSYHNHCNFPRNIVNPNNLVSLSIANVNFTDNYVDIDILSPAANIKAYQFTMSGITISSVVSLIDPVQFPVDLRYIAGTNEVFAISIQDSSFTRSTQSNHLVRIYFSSITDSVICISSIKEIVNQDAEKTITSIVGGCVNALNTGITTLAKPSDMVIIPNPATEQAYIHISGAVDTDEQITVTDASGRIVKVPINFVRDAWYEMNLSDLPIGVYFVVRKGSNVSGVSRFVKM
jgi:hypothetical protein